MVKKAMLIGVGVGKNVENAIYTSIIYNNPNFIAFVTTDQSKNTLLRKTIKVEDNNDLSSLEEIADNYEIYILENQEM